MSLFLLFESAAGYSLFEEKESEEIAEHLGDAQKSIGDYSKFSKMVKLVAFESFVSSEQALENINAISEGVLPEKLRFFLESNFPKPKKGKSAKVQLGVSEEKLATSIQDTLEFGCNRSQKVLELLRGIRLHFSKFIKELKEGDVEKTQLGLAHSYSRCKIKFNINRADNHIIQAISLLDQLDKDINTFAMRVREWYGWHFPELIKVVPDNIVYARIVNLLGSRATVTEEKITQLAKLLTDEDKAKEVIEASKSSMGTDISDLDMLNISRFALKVVHLDEYRQKLHNYLHDKMSNVAPNLASLIGDIVGARLISHAGSLVNLAKYPASTVQILGAEKALFRALKTRGNTPKYGLIFHSSFIGKAQTRDKGRISRYLANKCSIASRIDYFSETGTTIYGEKLKDQVEERLDFYKTGKAPRTNAEVIEEIKKSLKDQNAMKDDTESESETDAPSNKSAKSPKTPKKSKDAEEPKTPKSSKKSKEVETPKSSKKSKEVETPKSSKKSKKEEEPKTPKKSKDAEEPKTPKSSKKSKEVETPKSSKKSKEVETPKSSKKSKDVETPKSSKKSKKDEDSDSDAPLTGKKRKAEVATPKSEKRRKQ